VVRDLLNEAGVTDVGGLYQLASISPFGVQPAPHFYWAPVQPGYGTYVAMRLEYGEWVQEHRPTGTKVKVLSPFDIQLRHPDWMKARSKMFDPARDLQIDSPGVVPDRQDRMVYGAYTPEDIPDQVRESWGDLPVAPLTYKEDAPNRKYRRRA
jgi:hypothetical protein